MSKSRFQKRNKASSDPCNEGLDCADEPCEHEAEGWDCAAHDPCELDEVLDFADDPDCAKGPCEEGVDCVDDLSDEVLDCADDPWLARTSLILSLLFSFLRSARSFADRSLKNQIKW